MKTLKVAIVGCGSMAGFHMGAYKKNPNVEVYALCDTNENLLKKRGEQWNCQRLYTDEATMLAELPEIDVVDVVTSNDCHAECSIMALNAGKDVFCEKPMATNSKDAKRMLEAAKANGRKLMIGFVRRFGKDAVVAKELIDKDDLGEIYYAKASYLRRHGCPGGWFCDKKRSGGGPLIDIGIHVIDLARYLMGNPKPVSVSASTFSKLGARSQLKASISYTSVGRQEEEYNDVEDLAVGMIKFENGATLFAETSYSLNIKGDYNAVELCGTKGGISINPSVHFYTNLHNYMSDIDFVGTTQFDDDGIVDELRYFIDALLGKVEFGTTAEDGVVMMQILDAMYESAKTGKEVVIGE